MGAAAMMRTALIAAAALAVGLAGCLPLGPCGWDEALALGATYDVSLVELYTPASTTAFYSPEFGLTRSGETCGALDEIAVDVPVAIRLTQGPSASQDCSFWFAEMLDPVLGLGMRNPGLANNQFSNQITVSGRRDFGGGCEGGWEFSLHAPNDNPFVAQRPDSNPVLLAYRVFGTNTTASAACSTLIGREPTSGEFYCGDVFVATMARR